MNNPTRLQDHNGYISECEFRWVLQTVGEIDDEHVIDCVLADIHRQNGQIERSEFEIFVRSYLRDSDV
jgi:Ca2+-binding EF-hand superfamily protein